MTATTVLVTPMCKFGRIYT